MKEIKKEGSQRPKKTKFGVNDRRDLAIWSTIGGPQGRLVEGATVLLQRALMILKIDGVTVPVGNYKLLRYTW
jgi:hypothetical protein